MHDALVIALGNPILVGIYDAQGKLIEKIEQEGMGSDLLPAIFEPLLEKYTFNRLIYANGPGSFMGIKVTYLFLKTLSIVKNIPLFALDAFTFNENHPIKAVGKLYFVKNSNTISLQPLETPIIRAYRLPDVLSVNNFNADSAPYYGIDAVG